MARMAAWTTAWRARWARWCTTHDLDAAYALTVGLLAAYHGLAAVAAGVGLWALAPALSAVDVAFVVVSASTQTGLLPLPFKDLGTPAQALLFALVIATSAFLVNHLAPTIVAELRLRQRHRAHRREPEHRVGTGPHPATATTTAAVARPVMPAPLEEELAAVVQLRHVTVAYYVCVQAALLVAFVIHAGTSPAVLMRLRQTGQSSLAWSVTQTLSAFHQVPFLLDLAPIADADGHLDVGTLLLTALLVLLGNLLAPLAVSAVVAALAALARRRKRATSPFRRLLARAAAISPLLLPTPYYLVLLGALVVAGIVVHASVLLAITLTTTDGTAAGSVGEQVLAAVFSATALRTAGLTAVAIPALPLVGQLFYIVSMAVGAGPLTLVVRLARPLASTSTGVGTRGGTDDAQRAPSESTAASLSLLVLQVRQRDGSALSAGSAGSAAAGGTGSGPSATLPRALKQLKRRASHCSLPVPFEATSLDDDDAWPLTAPVRTDSRTATPWATVAHSQERDQQEQLEQQEQQHEQHGGGGVDEDRPLGADNSTVPLAAALPPPATAATASAARGLGKRRVLAVARAAFALVLRLDVVALLLALLVMAALEQPPNGDGYGAAGSALAVRLLFLLASSYGLIGLAPGLVLGVVDGASPGTKAVLMLVMLLGRLRTFPPAPSR